MELVICHYGEIALKGKNRRFFEEKLIENIKRRLNPAFFEFIKRISGRLIIKLTEAGIKNKKIIRETLKNVFGLVHFSFAISPVRKSVSQKREQMRGLNPFLSSLSNGVDSGQEVEEIKKAALKLLKDKKFKTFKISTQRSEKTFPLTSQEINEKVGEYILKKFKIQNPKSKIKVNLKKPDITCFIEIVEKFAFLYLEKIKGLGGLPVSVSGKAVVLLSGGIDSPAAAFFTMKRGIKVIFVHFHAYPYTKKESIKKVKKIVGVLDKFQFNSRLYLIPFAEIQKEILLKTPAKLRVILYRRFMFRIAELVARKEGALALVTGESVGQVASQTLENIRAIEEAVGLPVFRPLIGEDKEEIIRKAEEIGTFKISILPAEDCCSRFLPKHPETKAKLEEVLAAEKKLNINKLIEKAIKDAVIQNI